MTVRRILKVKRTTSGRVLLSGTHSKQSSRHNRITPASKLRCRRRSTENNANKIALIQTQRSSTTIGGRSQPTVFKRKKDNYHEDHDEDDDDDVTVQRSNKRMKRCHDDDNDKVDLTKMTKTGMYFSPDYTVVVSFL